MKLILDEWIVREVIDTLYMARTTLLGITGLDSPQEAAKKSANETAITRRISKAIDIIQQSDQKPMPEEQPCKDLETEIATWIPAHVKGNVDEDIIDAVKRWGENVARHFYELGQASVRIPEEKPNENLDADIEMEWNSFNKHLAVYGDESDEVVWLNWNSFNDVTRHFYELGRNTRKEE